MRNYFTVQAPVAGDHWQQCGNARYMTAEEAEAVYLDCSEHIAVALFQIDAGTGEFEQYMLKSNF